MTLRKQISIDLIDAMKAKDVQKRDTLRSLDSAIKNEEIAQLKREDGLDDAGVTVIIKRAIKQCKDSIIQYKNGGRDDLAQKEEIELNIIEQYLPEQMDEAAVRTIVERVVADTGATTKADMGKVMGPVMAEVGDQSDGNTVRTIVDEILA
ncbi:MAG: GatB/YqeY domain-containing protein [Patescibacteria group bacterium]|nr:GatB/YqeY domain-containing protein [Patescibacteria group bacterium]